MAISDSMLQFKLSQSPTFQGRVQIVMSKVAGDVLNEAASVPNHAERAQYAKQVLANPVFTAQQQAGFIAQSANVANTITIEDEGVVTSATDGALFSQINAYWNQMAGITATVEV
jgi:hypothetical protein